MKTLLKALAVTLIFCALGYGQASRYDNMTWSTTAVGGNTVLRPVGSASVTVCNYPATLSGGVCTNLATLYTDATAGTACTGSNGCSNPVTSDVSGNFGFWAQNGHYQYTVTVSGANYGPYDVTVAPTFGQPVFDARQFGNYPTGTVDVWVNAAITKAIAAGGGIVDARGLGGAQTIAAEIDLGDGTHPVTLLLPHYMVWNMSGITNGTSCGIKVFNGSSIIGTAASSSAQSTITASASVNADSMVCTNPATSGYVRVEGFMLYNANGATFAHGLLDAQNLYDNSKFQKLTIANYATNGDGLRVYNACCGASFDEITSNAGLTGGRPVFIQADSSHANINISFNNLSAGHAGTGWSEIEMSGGATTPSDAVNRNITFTNLYTEFGTGVTNALKIVDARGVLVNGWTAGVVAGAAGSMGLNLSQSAANQVRDITIKNFYYGQASGSTGLSNSITGESICTSTCYVPSYVYGGSGGSQIAQPSVLVDNEWDWKSAAGNIVYQWPTSGNAVIRNYADSALNIIFDSGNTADQNALNIYRDRGTQEWQAGKGNDNNFYISDLLNSNLPRFFAQQNNQTIVNSGNGSAPVRVNSSANSGTGGVEIWSGGATPVKVIGFSATGAIDISGGTGGLKLKDQGQCTMASGTCSAQGLGHTYAAAPQCFLQWTGTGTLTGITKAPSTTTTVTPASSVNTDTAQVNWACYGN